MFLSSGSDITTGTMALINMVLLLFGVLISWYALQIVRWEVFVRDAKSRPAAVLRLLLAITLGYQLARFISEYMLSTTMLKQFF
jgi:uncharacterized integral membrane protein (TIGR02327 family)